MPQVTFSLNGRDTSTLYEEGMNFLELLREECGILSTKDGCAPQGYCGCCTILVDGRAALACLRKPESIAGHDIITLEGIPEEQRRTLARAFVREGGLQCGFCTPGIVVRACSLMNHGGASDPDKIQRALSGHLCRCTGYTRIVDAIRSAGEAWENGGDLPGAEPRQPHFFGEAIGLTRTSPNSAHSDGIGSSSHRYRGEEHALGDKPYVADMEIDGMLHAAAVMSRHPRARVLSIDPSAVLSMPGVERVITAGDVPGQRYVGLIRPDWPVFVATGELTRCVGDMLALVLADTRFHAGRAAEALEAAVEYEVLEPVTDPVAALDPDAPQVHESGNLLEVCSFSRGDVEAALAASKHVLERTFTTQRIEHAFLEPEACLAVPTTATASRIRLKVYTQGQGVHDDQAQIASVLGVPPETLEVELVANGGAFGGKEDLSIQAQTALAAQLTGRPIRTVLTREQSIRMHPKRHPITLHYTVGADAEGHLTAVRARIIGDTGAYASVGMKVLERAGGHSCGPYRVPNVDVEATTVYTNNPPCGAMRGFGANQAAFAIEGIMDLLAEEVGVDGYDIRERNILGPGDPFATGQIMTASCGIRQTLEAVREVYKGARYAGIGCGIKNTGIGNGMDDSGRLLLRVLEGGAIEILSGYTEMGQGLFTVLRQVVNEETGLDPEIMSVRTASDPRVVCGMTTASRATALLTAAGQIAARELAADLEHAPLEEFVGKEYFGEYVCDFTTKPGVRTDSPVTHMTFSYATQVVILDDEGRLERVVAAHDVGRAINPLQCAGQIEGSVHMGLGYALSEDLPCTGGHPDSLLLRDLGILKAKETPQIDVILVEVPDEVGGYGSKGVGEIGLVPTAGAVAGALHAFDGVRRFDLPMSDAPAAAASVPKSRRVAPVTS
ncbi:MAG: selenium-dependent xanthine dehydrogenase [Gemmatimonadetes bacterium]|nr:selenium-dependent xanthine dehydrogenase [Gemmatimonadota bacterium]